jgi:NTP pyrophosphatase (non-canonical NTP hydrolase)
MDVKIIEEILDLIKSKHLIDQKNTWSEGSATYFNELKKEIDEVEEELLLGRSCYLEDELGDVFWDYLNLLHNLEQEGLINVESVFERSLLKFSERLSAISSGSNWGAAKQTQKLRLEKEHQLSLAGKSLDSDIDK